MTGTSARSELSADWQRAFDWVERTVGGRLVGWESQPRWRPAWFLEAERDGTRVSLYWRGARPEFHGDVRPLAREAGVIEVLARHGVPVPRVYGLCEDPPGLLLERLPGRFNLATATDDAERVAVLDHYVDQLVRVHAIDPAELEAVGLRRPQDAQRSVLGELPGFERIYRGAKCRPEPMIEFLLGWVRRKAPRDRERVSFVLCDTGQFLFDAGRVTGLIDFELAYLGDAAADLAGLRTRDLSEPLGDLDRALRRYAEHTGEPVDPRLVDYHTIRFSLANPLSMAHLCAAPEPSLNFAQYLSWYVVYSRCALEVLAHTEGIALDPPVLPESVPSRRGVAHAHLVAGLDPARDEGDPSRVYDLDRHRRVAEYLERSDRYGPALAADDLDDAAAVLGARPRDWREADAALEACVLDAGPERDAELARLFHRRLLREEALLGPALRELEGARMPPVLEQEQGDGDRA